MTILYPRFTEYIKTNQLITTNDTIILAFSGGKDSVTLFHLLDRLKKEMPFRLIIAYFNHNLRSDANKEQEWVTEFCTDHQLELIVGSKDVIQFKTQNKLNLEHAASLSRYSFFKHLSSRFENAKVATAHSLSDLTETFLIKLSRGSGLQGLTTIYSKKENTIIRPLLVFQQEEILDFLNRNKLPYYTDYTNEEDCFLRNRIRHHVIPRLTEIEPTFHQHVFKTVTILQDEYDFFSSQALEILKKNLIMDAILPFSSLCGLHIALQRHVIREYIRKLKGNLLDIDFQHIEIVRTGHLNSKGVAIPGVELSFLKGYIFPKGISIPGYHYDIKEMGSIEIKEISTIINVCREECFVVPKNNNEILVPSFKLKFPLLLRNPQPADKYMKINTGIRQKVNEMIRASGFPSQLRNLCPVLINGDNEIIWVMGSPIAEDYKVAEDSTPGYIKITVVN